MNFKMKKQENKKTRKQYIIIRNIFNFKLASRLANQIMRYTFDMKRSNVLQIRLMYTLNKIIGGTKTNYWQLTKLNISDY